MRIILVFVGLFLALVSVAMATYPGGNWLERGARGHDLARNFLCDLLSPVAVNGLPNPVASLAMQAALGVLAIGLTVTWWLMPRLLDAPRLSLAIRVSAVLSLLGLISVPLTPPSASSSLHAVAVLGGGVPAVIAWGLSLHALGRQPRTRALAELGLAALLGVVMAFLLYAHALVWRTHPNLALPLSHRLATLLCLVWLVRLGIARRGPSVTGSSYMSQGATGAGIRDPVYSREAAPPGEQKL